MADCVVVRIDMFVATVPLAKMSQVLDTPEWSRVSTTTDCNSLVSTNAGLHDQLPMMMELKIRKRGTL